MSESDRAYRALGGARFIDCERLWRSTRGVSPSDRLRSLMAASGVVFFDGARRLVARPSVGIVGIGGLPLGWSDSTPEDAIELPSFPGCFVSIEQIRKAHDDMMGWGGFCTYLNPRDLTPAEMVKIMVDAGHVSTAHMAGINIMVLGASTAVENEFNSQRDIIHLARLTEARTTSQVAPPVVVLYPELAPLFEEVLDHTAQAVTNVGASQTGRKRKDHLEAVNIAYPAAKATLFILSSSLRNLQKLISALADSGKEEEYKRILALMNDTLSSVWPHLFRPTNLWGYSYPQHFVVD